MADNVVESPQSKLEKYCDFVTSLASPDSMADFKSKIGMAGIGLAAEGGEAADIVKKVLYHGQPFDEATRQKLIKEVGDVLFYAAFMARNVLGVTVEEIIDANVTKLEDRYKKGKFTTEEFLAKEAAKGCD